MQQLCSVGLRLRFGHATVSLITLFSAIINHLFTSTYKTRFRAVDPKVEGSIPFGLVEALSSQVLTRLFRFFDSKKSLLKKGIFIFDKWCPNVKICPLLSKS